jgi:hypothetical protein
MTLSPAVSGTVGAGGFAYATTVVLFDWVLPAVHCPLPALENLANVETAFSTILTCVAAFVVHRLPPKGTAA